MRSYDVIVIGGGTNGLAAAGRLAKAGRKVLVLEQSSVLGGGAQTCEFAPGYRVSPVAHLLTMLDPRVEHGLDLRRHGLTYAAKSIASTALSATGDHLVLEGAYGQHVKGSLSAADREAWRTLRDRLMRFASVLSPFKDITPPRLSHAAGNPLLKLAQLGMNVRRLGRDDLREFMRLLLINVADVLDDEVTDDRLKGLIAFDTVLGAHLGPRSPNSLILLLNRLAGEAAGERAGLALPKGGMGAAAAAMAASVQWLGVDIRLNSKVVKILIEGDQIAGLALSDGLEVRAQRVVSAINPKTTLLSLVGPRHLDTSFIRRAQNIRMRGTACKLHLALTAAPDFRGADPRTRLVIAPSIREVETAFNAVKYGGFSERPVMEIVLPSAFEEGHAPAGHHVLSAIVQFAPYALRGGWASGQLAFTERIMAVLEAHAPGISRLVVAQQLLTPEDLEAHYGFVGGNWHHGELAVEQMLFLRPMIGAAQYETPIAGLYLGSAGSHPGGGVSGAAGWNAAERILATEGRR